MENLRKLLDEDKIEAYPKEDVDNALDIIELELKNIAIQLEEAIEDNYGYKEVLERLNALADALF